MTDKETVKIDETQKQRLDKLREQFNYAEPSYSGLIEYLLDSHDGEVDGGEELPNTNTSSGSEVTRTVDGGDDTSDEGEDFQGDEDDTLTAEQRASQFRQ